MIHFRDHSRGKWITLVQNGTVFQLAPSVGSCSAAYDKSSAVNDREWMEMNEFFKHMRAALRHLHGKPRLCYPETPDGGIA
jgi:hypothetical protein